MIRIQRFTVLMFVLFYDLVLAQPGFNQMYALGGTGSGLINGVLKNDTLMLAGGIRYSTTTPWSVALIKADTTGNIISEHPYFDISGNDLGYGVNYDVKLLPDGGVVFVGGYFSETSQFIIKYNDGGDVILFKKIPYDDTYSMATFDFELYKNGYIIGGTLVDISTNKLQPFLTRTDGEGNVLWTKRYPEPGLDQNSRCMKVLDENTILIGSVLFNSDLQTWAKSRIFALDSLGNVKWDWSTPDNNEGLISDIIRLDNGDWLYLNKKFEIYSDSLLSWSQLVRRDSNFNLLFATKLSPSKWVANQTNDLVPSPDGNWIISESTALVGPDFSWLGASGWAGCLSKVTPEGQILWQTCDTVHWGIPGVISEETASGHVVLPSGSSILIGFSNRYKPSPARTFGWMMKVDANGCLMTPCTSNVLEEPALTESALFIYPNPAAQTINVFFPKATEAQRLRVFNSLGTMVEQVPLGQEDDKKTLDVSTWSAGVYYLQLTNAERVLFVEKFVVQH